MIMVRQELIRSVFNEISQEYFLIMREINLKLYLLINGEQMNGLVWVMLFMVVKILYRMLLIFQYFQGLQR